MEPEIEPTWVPKQQYVSFDVFDTLIKRSVAMPADLFQLVEQHCEKSGMRIPSGFAQKRREAELDGNEEAGRHIRLEEIYDKLRDEYGEYTDDLMELEAQMELMGCQPNPKCVEWFNRYITEGRTVVLISDMYLPSEAIARMLDKCGIRGYSKLYVSCEYGAKKGDGSLFRIVLDELNIRPSQLIHIGDNRRSDVLAPFKMGIRAVWRRNDQKRICRVPKTVKRGDELAYRTLQACIRNASQGMTGYEKMGCKLFGPQLYGFTLWLEECLKRDEIRDAYFMARDGYMLKRAFDEMRIEGVRTHYFYCSRRAFQLPLLRNSTGFQDTNILWGHRKKYTIRRLLLQLGLAPDEYASVCRELGLDIDHVYPIEDFTHSEKIERFYQSIRNKVVENAASEYISLMKYFESLHMPEKVALIDIGFFGTIQNSFNQCIHQNSLGKTTYGYYFNLSDNAQKEYGINAYGYHKGSKNNESLFEAQFLAPHGSLKRFAESENGDVFPEFESFEYKDDESKLIDEVKIISQYQEGAIAFIRYMREALLPDSISVGYDVAMHDFNRVLVNPTLQEASFWGKFRFINYTIGYLANPRGIFYYILHPRQLYSDVYACGWRIGFLKRLLKLPLPYDKIYSLLKSRR